MKIHPSFATSRVGVCVLALAFSLLFPLQRGVSSTAPRVPLQDPVIESFEITAGGNATLRYRVSGSPFTRILRSDVLVDNPPFAGFSASTMGLGDGLFEVRFNVASRDKRFYQITVE